MIKLISDNNILSEFKTEWDNIFEKDDNASPFQQFDYIYASCQFYKNPEDKLYILLMKDAIAKTWYAAFPFIISPKGTLKFLNYAHSDFCMPVIDPLYNNYNLYRELAEYIIKDKNVRGLELHNLSGNNLFLDGLSPHFPFHIIHQINHYSTLSVQVNETDKDFIDCLRNITSKKKWVHRKMLKSSNDNWSLKMYSLSMGNNFPLDEINTLSNEMISIGIRTKDYFSENMLAFWKSLYENNILTIALLYDKDIIMAANLMIFDSKRNEYISWITLYTEKSWNVAINIKILEYIYINGGNLNFARGIYDYKLVNFHPDVKALFCVKIAKTKWGHFKNIMSTAFHFSKPIIKSFLRR